MITTSPDSLLTVDHLLRAFAPLGLIDDAMRAQPPEDALTVLRRALERLPADVRLVLDAHDLGPRSPLPPWQRGPLAALLVDALTEPALDDATAWMAAIDAHCTALAPGPTGESAAEVRHELIETVLEWRHNAAADALTGAARTARMDEIVEIWMLAVRDGFVPPTWLACLRAEGLWHSYADRDDAGRAADIAVTAAQWAEHTEIAESAVGLTRYRATAIACLAEAGRFDEVVALADEWDVVVACEAGFGDDDPLSFQVHLALAAAHRAHESYDLAVQHARAGVWAAECGLGADHEVTLAALAQLAMTLLAADRAGDALAVARHAYELTEAHEDGRPEGRAHAAVGVALCLHTIGDHDGAEAFAGEAWKVARHRLGPDHHDTEALRLLAGEPDAR